MENTYIYEELIDIYMNGENPLTKKQICKARDLMNKYKKIKDTMQKRYDYVYTCYIIFIKINSDFIPSIYEYPINDLLLIIENNISFASYIEGKRHVSNMFLDMGSSDNGLCFINKSSYDETINKNDTKESLNEEYKQKR